MLSFARSGNKSSFYCLAAYKKLCLHLRSIVVAHTLTIFTANRDDFSLCIFISSVLFSRNVINYRLISELCLIQHSSMFDWSSDDISIVWLINSFDARVVLTCLLLSTKREDEKFGEERPSQIIGIWLKKETVLVEDNPWCIDLWYLSNGLETKKIEFGSNFFLVLFRRTEPARMVDLLLFVNSFLRKSQHVSDFFMSNLTFSHALLLWTFENPFVMRLMTNDKKGPWRMWCSSWFYFLFLRNRNHRWPIA